MDLSLSEQDSEEPNITEITPIQEFYKDAHILISGGTGFLGKLLIEKLLRSCNELSKIYLIVRPKKGKDMPTRLEEMFQDVAFDSMKRQYPKFRQKIVGIRGDFVLPNLGLASEDRKVLQDNVSIIFHVAATLNFDQKLKTAMATNVQATHDMLQLGREVQNLKAFMYVSTAYSNCPEKVIEEKIYKSVAPYEALLTVTYFPESILEQITPVILDKYPNIYVFTKQVAEGLIAECGKGLPVGILRPSVGEADSNAIANIVPADMVINSLIAACWEVGVAFRENSQSEMKIYNYESNTSNVSIIRDAQMVAKLYSKAQNLIEKLGYFATKSFIFKSENISAMLSKMTPRDRDIFFCDMSAISWDDFFITYFKGIRLYLFHDPLDTLKEGRIKVRR
nr:unnamed protein product [Callosobruchus analis]